VCILLPHCSTRAFNLNFSPSHIDTLRGLVVIRSDTLLFILSNCNTVHYFCLNEATTIFSLEFHDTTDLSI